MSGRKSVIDWFMRFVRCFVVLILLAAMFGAPCFAQTSQPDTYMVMVNEAVKRPPNFDFMYFRALYARTPQYDPIGETAQRQILALTDRLKKANDAGAAQEDLANYRALVAMHLANLDVVRMAEALSRDDPRLGSPALFHWIGQGLIDSMVLASTGDATTQAYTIVTLGEEAALFKQLHLRLIDTKSMRNDTQYLNLHHVADQTTGAEKLIYTDITLPMTALSARPPRSAAPLVQKP